MNEFIPLIFPSNFLNKIGIINNDSSELILK